MKTKKLKTVFSRKLYILRKMGLKPSREYHAYYLNVLKGWPLIIEQPTEEL